ERADEDVERADLLRVGLAVRPAVTAHHQDDRRRGRPALLADLADDLGARQPREHPRQQHEVEPRVPERLEAGLSVVRLGQAVSEGGDESSNPIDVARLVLDQENLFWHELNLLCPEKLRNQGGSREGDGTGDGRWVIGEGRRGRSLRGRRTIFPVTSRPSPVASAAPSRAAGPAHIIPSLI